MSRRSCPGPHGIPDDLDSIPGGACPLCVDFVERANRDPPRGGGR